MLYEANRRSLDNAIVFIRDEQRFDSSLPDEVLDELLSAGFDYTINPSGSVAFWSAPHNSYLLLDNDDAIVLVEKGLQFVVPKALTELFLEEV